MPQRVQAPHKALPQPNLVPTSFSSPRSTQSSWMVRLRDETDEHRPIR
jgi:hypothetical protein